MFNFLKKIIRGLQSRPHRTDGYFMSKQMRERFRSPTVNVDGTPMIGRYDVNGRGFGSGGDFGSSEF